MNGSAKDWKPTFKPSFEAFKQAIDKGVLSHDPTSEMYAGNWMYMHTDEKGDAFKNIITRNYIFVK